MKWKWVDNFLLVYDNDDDDTKLGRLTKSYIKSTKCVCYLHLMRMVKMITDETFNITYIVT